MTPPAVAEIDAVPGHTEPLTECELRNLAAVADVLPFWNAHDVDGVLRFYDPDIAWRNVAMEETYEGKPAVGDYLRQLFTAFPDLTFDVRRRIARGDLVAEEWVMAGTHRGEFIGVPATGRPLEILGMSMVEMRDGRFLRDEFYFDAAGVMRQLGLLPSLAVTNGRTGRFVLKISVRGKQAGSAVVGALTLRRQRAARARRRALEEQARR